MALTTSELPRKVPVEVIESGANTFTATQILLPNTKGQTVFDLDQVQIRLPTPSPAAADDLGSYRVQLQRDTGEAPTAMLNNKDDRVLFNADVLIASGTEAADLTFIRKDVQGEDHARWAEYIANDSVYICVEGAALATAVTINGKLIGSVETLTGKQVTALLLSQIS